MAKEKKIEPPTEVEKARFVYNYTPIAERANQKEQHNCDETKVERAGFVPMEKRIKAILQSGQRLDAARRAQYHYGEGEPIDDSHTNFAVDPNLDISDIGHVIDTGRSALAETDRQRKTAAKKARDKKADELKEQIKEATKSAKKMPAPPVVGDEPPQPPDGSSPQPTK